MAEDIGGIPQPNAAEENFTTFVSLIVSVDYSIATTNDRGTPHGMRVIAAIPLIRNHYETDGSLLKGILITSYDFQWLHESMSTPTSWVDLKTLYQ